jgi:hypothetical protein
MHCSRGGNLINLRDQRKEREKKERGERKERREMRDFPLAMFPIDGEETSR